MPAGVCRFGVLGPLVIELDGVAVPLNSGRQRTLLAVLIAADGSSVTRDRLIRELWGEQPPANAVATLHVHLSKLRLILGERLVSSPSGYSLPPGSCELDARRFDELVARASKNPAHAADLLAEALDLFRGNPLSDVSSSESVEDWRRDLEAKRLVAIGSRIETELADGGGAALVPELERLVREHPFEEQLWSQLMLALYRTGRQADALETYQRARRLLTTELGLEPGEALRRLQQQILSGDPTLAPPAREPAAAPVRESRLPRSPTRLIGRDAELGALAGLLADPDVRLLTITGPAGVGKTRLLLELARSQEPQHADGAVLVHLERLTDPALICAAIATTLLGHDESDGPTAVRELPRYLRSRELVLLLDNFEHLLAGAAQVAELLAHAPRLRVLVSSRSALRLRGEQVFDLEPLALPAEDVGPELAQSPAVQLFAERALAANRRLTLDPAAMGTIAGICRALDGLPLAIELAAARSSGLSPVEIAEQLSRPLLIGEHALRDLPARQQTLDAAIRWSHDLLSEPARSTLLAAGVFAGEFSPESLDAVTGRPAQRHLEELMQAHLIERLGDNRFLLPELVRAFALDELAVSPEAAVIRNRHREHLRTAFDRALLSDDLPSSGDPLGEVLGVVKLPGSDGPG